MAVIQKTGELPYTVFIKILLPVSDPVAVDDLTGHKPPVIIIIGADPVIIFEHVHTEHVAVFCKFNLRIFLLVSPDNHRKGRVNEFHIIRPGEIMEREKNGAVRSNALHGIKAGPVRNMIDALPMEKMAKIRRKSELHDFKRSCFFSEKQLNLLDRVIELRHGTGTIPDLLILLPVTILIPGRNKILHKRFLSQTVPTGMKIYTRHNDNRSEFPESDCR